MSALSDLTTEVNASVAAIDAAVVVLGSTGDATQLVALTAQLATARIALDAALTAHST